MDYYLDTEFNGFGGKLISLGIVRQDGHGLYVIYPKLESYTEYVRQNVLPHLENAPAFALHMNPGAKAGNLLEEFFKGDPCPNVICDWPDDVKYFCEEMLLGPGKRIKVPRITFDIRPIESYPTKLRGAVQHNAFWDALALKAKCEELDEEHIKSGAYFR
jgi:hypothetical protein